MSNQPRFLLALVRLVRGIPSTSSQCCTIRRPLGGRRIMFPAFGQRHLVLGLLDEGIHKDVALGRCRPQALQRGCKHNILLVGTDDGRRMRQLSTTSCVLAGSALLRRASGEGSVSQIQLTGWTPEGHESANSSVGRAVVGTRSLGTCADYCTCTYVRQ